MRSLEKKFYMSSASLIGRTSVIEYSFSVDRGQRSTPNRSSSLLRTSQRLEDHEKKWVCYGMRCVPCWGLLGHVPPQERAIWSACSLLHKRKGLSRFYSKAL